MTPFSVLPVIPPRFELGSDKAATPTALRICCCQHFKQTCFDLLHTRAYTLGRVRTCEALWRKILSLNVISELLCVDKWRIRAPMTSYLWLPFKSPISCLCGFDKAHQLRSMSGIWTHAGQLRPSDLKSDPFDQTRSIMLCFAGNCGYYLYRTFPHLKMCRNWSRTSIQGLKVLFCGCCRFPRGLLDSVY